MAAQIRIDVWSDYVCPFCYLQLPEIRRLEQSLGALIELHWRAFELRPTPNPTLDPAGDYMRSTWQRSVYPMERERGMALQLPPVQPYSRRALEAAMFAGAQNAFDRMHEAIFSAFFVHGRDIGDIDVLVEIGENAGLPADELRRALFDQRYTAEVEDDQKLAYELGISGVPMILLRRNASKDDASNDDWQQAAALQGAVTYSVMQAAVERLHGNQPAAG